MNGFQGKAAVVTGAASGIGRAIAEALAARGASVVVVDVDGAGAAAAAAAIGARAVAVAADVATDAGATAAADGARDAFGRLDVLVNSAGVQRYGSVVDTPEETWDEVLAVNLKAVYLVARRCVPLIEGTGGGAVVNIASVQALSAQRGVAAYAASKGGILALTRAMAVDHAPRVRVNAICPGSVDTPMLREAAALFSDDPDAAVRRWGAMHPIGRVAQPSEVAEAAVFLASPAASFITGAALLVDGGLLSIIQGT